MVSIKKKKLFVGGLNWDTTDESMKEYFSKFGPVASCMVMRDTMTGQSRGFGFLTMENVEDVDKVLEVEEHHLDGKKIDPKRAVPKTDQERCEKIFVGGISPEVNQDEFKEFFQKFGPIAEATLMVDRQTGRPRGFGFVTFEDAQSVDNALEAKDLVIKDRQVEIKRAMPKAKRNVMPNTRYAGAAMMMGRGGMFQQQANPYGNMAAMAAAYYGRMNNNNNNNRYQQQQDDIDSGRHHGGSSSTTSSSGGSRDRRHRDSSHDRYYRSSSSSRHRYEDRSGGGAVHASSSSSSRNQSSYRPY
ncbi:uncharacterized protein BX664DRAFT_112921 [Halteromyces radiatus]|uniref:uncharacterized protein n=1 Tax=Halteromyces radiatus TaxID=101107 RepID=UPI002220A1D5|nr:uncharacterized protein BX664DRAFT_112921 [Halteromyces radiatus]KAI8093710.1 hypothetical protein BX664DRAFT_112921 [Halteromyces radiatus]